MNDLIQLCILGTSLHERLVIQIVHLRTADRDDINRTRLAIDVVDPGRNVTLGH